MNKILISISACLPLALCACKGRHADGTPTGETVEVNIEVMEPIPAQVAAPSESSLPADSAALSTPADSTASTTAATNL